MVEPFEEIGIYCEDLHRVLTGPGDLTGNRTLVFEAFTRWDYHSGELKAIPNIVSGWDIRKTARRYTFYLRKGMKWSDGEPFTADDILFWYQDIALNAGAVAGIPRLAYASRGEPVVIEKVDDYTVTFRSRTRTAFSSSSWASKAAGIIVPKHYLQQFHPAYADEGRAGGQGQGSAGFEHWYQLFAEPERPMALIRIFPVLRAWKVEVPFPRSAWLAMRNPYYWKVDTDGQAVALLRATGQRPGRE